MSRTAALGWWALWSALASHYRRHPGQLAMALAGVIVAGALYSGVQTINAQARDSFARAESTLGQQQVDRLHALPGKTLTRADFVRLRRAGVPVSPLIRGEVTLANGTTLKLLGIDLPTLPHAMLSAGGATAGSHDQHSLGGGFMQPPWQLRLAPDSARALDLDAGDRPRLADGQRLPPIMIQSQLAPGTGVSDIAAAAALLGRGNRIDALLLPRQATLPTGLAGDYRRISAKQTLSPGQLSQSFRLNLTAMGFLALVVGLFIVHSAMGLALSQRLGSFAVLRALGVSRRALVTALALELLLLGLVGALIGVIGGVALASVLMPGVAGTLASLYDERVASAVILTPRGLATGLAMTLLGTLSAGLSTLRHAARVSVLAPIHSGFEARGGAGHRRRLAAVGLLGLAGAAGLWLLLAAQSGWPAAELRLMLAFAVVALMLVGSALVLPALLDGAVILVTRAVARGVTPARTALAWLLADTRTQLPRLSLALAALLLALSANLGVSSMVGGFRLTFLDWLDQRLAAELYVHATPEQIAPLEQWLDAQHSIRHWQRLRHLDSRVAGRPVDVRAIPPDDATRQRWPLLRTLAHPWARLGGNDGGVLINEQLAHTLNRGPGDRLRFTTPQGERRATIVGVYADYGNPRGELTLALTHADALWPVDAGRTSFNLYLPRADSAAIRARLQRQFELANNAVIDQHALKHSARQVFERTFAITRALNTLTLGVAALALLSALLALGRWRRAQLAPLWALGLSRRALALASAAQILVLAVLTALAALPLGLVLTEALVALINVEAFGWRLPLHVFPARLVMTVAVAVLVALLGGALTAWQLWRTPPRRLLEQFRS